MNIEESSGIRGRLAALMNHSDDLHLLLLGEFGAPPPNAALLACGLQAGASALPQHRPLKLSEGPDHFVCAGGFTSAAEQEARTQEKRKITLLGLDRLFDLWVEHYEKISEAEKRLLPLKPVYYIAASEQPPSVCSGQG